MTSELRAGWGILHEQVSDIMQDLKSREKSHSEVGSLDFMHHSPSFPPLALTGVLVNLTVLLV